MTIKIMKILPSCSQMRSKGCQGVQNVSVESLECFCKISNIILIVGYFFGTFWDYFHCVWSNWANNCLKQPKMTLLLRHFDLANLTQRSREYFQLVHQKYPNIKKRKLFKKLLKFLQRHCFSVSLVDLEIPSSFNVLTDILTISAQHEIKFFSNIDPFSK